MTSVGLAMALYNEENTLPRWLDEGLLSRVDAYAISVDEKTTDSTRQILCDHGLEWAEMKFENFSQMTNFNIERLDTDYVLTVAPDEMFEWSENLRGLVNEGLHDLYLFPRVHWADLERTIKVPSLNGDDWQPRLHRKHIRFSRPVHEWPVGQRSEQQSAAMRIHHYAPYYEKLEPARRNHKIALYGALQGSPETRPY